MNSNKISKLIQSSKHFKVVWKKASEKKTCKRNSIVIAKHFFSLCFLVVEAFQFSPTENKNVVFFCQRPPTRLLLNIRKSSHLFCYCTFCSCNCWLPCKALRCVDSWLFGCLTAWHSISLTGSCISVIHHLLQKEFRYEQPFQMPFNGILIQRSSIKHSRN